MKKFGIMILGALAVLSAGCSKDVDTEPSVLAEDAWKSDESLPVPIQFGSPNIVDTKASIESLADLVGKKIGIFGVDVAADESWVEGADNVLLYNVPATYNSDTKMIDFYQSPSNNTVVKRYYPLVSAYNYTFYAYYSRSASGNFYKAADGESINHFTAKDVAIGYDDILWARVDASELSYEDNKYKGFNARYIRKANTAGQYDALKPELNLEHLTTQLVFQTTLAPAADDGDMTPTIVSLTVKDAVTTADFCIAHQDDKACLNGEGRVNEGGFVPVTRGDLTVKNIANLAIGEDIPEGLFVVAKDAEGLAQETITAVLTLRYPSMTDADGNSIGSGDTTDVTITLKPKYDEDKHPYTTFQPGYRYTFNISVSATKAIELYLTSTDWIDAEGEAVYDAIE